MRKDGMKSSRVRLESGLLSKKVLQDAEYLAWSTVHGLALLVLEGPLYKMPREVVLALGERLVVMVERGLGYPAAP